MHDIYLAFLNAASQTGLELLVNFEFTSRNMPNSPYGIYGSLNYKDEPVPLAAKYRALMDFLASQSPPHLVGHSLVPPALTGSTAGTSSAGTGAGSRITISGRSELATTSVGDLGPTTKPSHFDPNTFHGLPGRRPISWGLAEMDE
jgi:hypothetical protein